jgi:hypothetical protein
LGRKGEEVKAGGQGKMSVWIELGGIIFFMFLMGFLVGMNSCSLIVSCGDCQMQVEQSTWCNSTGCDRKFDISVNDFNATYVCNCPEVIIANLDTK